jgi:hypothetical protein
VDVAANDAVDLVPLRLGGQRLLEGADEVDRVLDLVLGPLRQRPVGRAEYTAQPVEHAVGGQREIVGFVAEQREPARLRDDEVEHVAVHDEVAAAVGGLVHDVLDDLDAAEMRAVIAAQEFVVIAGDVDDAGALARLAQQLLHHVVMRLRPVPGGLQRPAVDDIADEIEDVGLVPAQEVEEFFGLTAARAEMHVGDEKRAISFRGEVRHEPSLVGVLFMWRGV